MLATAFAFASRVNARVEVLVPFDEAAFAKAQQNEETIVVESYAGWCLACKVQAPLLSKLRQDPEFKSVRLFKIGEHTPMPVWKQFRLKAYGVIILYKGRIEIGRLSGAKNEPELRSFLRKGDKRF